MTGRAAPTGGQRGEGVPPPSIEEQAYTRPSTKEELLSEHLEKFPFRTVPLIGFLVKAAFGTRIAKKNYIAKILRKFEGGEQAKKALQVKLEATNFEDLQYVDRILVAEGSVLFSDRNTVSKHVNYVIKEKGWNHEVITEAIDIFKRSRLKKPEQLRAWLEASAGVKLSDLEAINTRFKVITEGELFHSLLDQQFLLQGWILHAQIADDVKLIGQEREDDRKIVEKAVDIFESLGLRHSKEVDWLYAVTRPSVTLEDIEAIPSSIKMCGLSFKEEEIFRTWVNSSMLSSKTFQKDLTRFRDFVKAANDPSSTTEQYASAKEFVEKIFPDLAKRRLDHAWRPIYNQIWAIARSLFPNESDPH